VKPDRVVLPSLLTILQPAVGPSSSHTLGPMRAGLAFRRRLVARRRLPDDPRLVVTLYGSLAHTGKGHLTDLALVAGLSGYGPRDVIDRPMSSVYNAVASAGALVLPSGAIPFDPARDILFDRETPPPRHPNTMRFELRDRAGGVVLRDVLCSVGGGALLSEAALDRPRRRGAGRPASARELLDDCARRGESLADYAWAMEAEVHGHPRPLVASHLENVWTLMRSSIDRGLRTEGVLPGPLRVDRRAAAMRARFEARGDALNLVSEETTRASLYAIAVAEENAGGGAIVTAPTCGSAGVLPACLRVLQESARLSDDQIHAALAVAGVVGGLAVAKASIAGALVGCQGEIGVASAMAAAAVCHLLGGPVADQVDRAAETALEHFLGLTCDPVAGLVQIPCIERNAAGAASALNAASLAMISGGRDRVSFDATLEAMHRTGLDMGTHYKETSLGGLAAIPDLDRDGLPDVVSSV